MDFERGKPPKEAIGIGLFREREFDTLEEAKAWFIQNLVAILGLNFLCDPWPTPEQFNELRSYADKYIFYKGKFETWPADNIIEGVAQLYRDLNDIVMIKEIR